MISIFLGGSKTTYFNIHPYQYITIRQIFALQIPFLSFFLESCLMDWKHTLFIHVKLLQQNIGKANNVCESCV